MKNQFLKTAMIGAFAAALAATAFVPATGNAASTDDAEASAVLESVRQNYLAGMRLDALKTKKAKTDASATAKDWLVRVKANEVNMATNRVDKNSQRIAVTIGGNTYMVSNRIEEAQLVQNATSRYAVDPLTRKRIDKATAATYADASGRILYFESDATCANFLDLANRKVAGETPSIR